MLEVSNTLVKALQNSNQVLFVMHEYLPLPLALWVPSLVSLLKKQGKGITVLVSQEMAGWPRKVDEVYPTDMVLALDKLRQIVSIPITHQGENIGDVSYRVGQGKLEITVIPVRETLDLSKVQTTTEGKIYDTVIGVGVSASHPLISVLNGSQASLSSAKAFFLGTYALKGALSEHLSFIPSLDVIDQQEDLFLREILQAFTDASNELEPLQRELVTLFIQSIVASSQQFSYLDKEGYEYLAKIADDSMDSGKMASLFTGDFAQQNRILQQILLSAQKSTNGELLLFTVTAKQLQQLGASVNDIVTALYYLPKYPLIKQIVVAVEESVQQHHIFMNGQREAVKQIAMKYGFPRTEKLTGGLVSGIHFSKLCQDVTRVAGKEEMLPQNVPDERVIIEQPTEEAHEVAEAPVARMPMPRAEEIQESPSIEVFPSLDEVLSNTAARNDVVYESEMEVAEAVDIPSAIPEMTPMNTEVVVPPQVPQMKPAPAVTNNIPTSSGLDFAAIAKKMRESIT